ncbi:hypothetical protein SDJN03_05224, partial [Cucurbita argyrosperma subsp. sororia]
MAPSWFNLARTKEFYDSKPNTCYLTVATIYEPLPCPYLQRAESNMVIILTCFAVGYGYIMLFQKSKGRESLWSRCSSLLSEPNLVNLGFNIS